MLKFNLTSLTVLLFFLSSCQENETKPDLTTALAGHFRVTYTMTDLDNWQSISGAPGSSSTVQLIRKDNNTLMLDVNIDDGAIQIKDLFLVTVIPASLEGDGLLLPGLDSRYKLEHDTFNSLGTSEINLYKDGTIRGGISYVNSTRNLVSLTFAP